MKRIFALVLAFCLFIGLSGCESNRVAVSGTNLMNGVHEGNPEVVEDLSTDSVAVTDFPPAASGEYAAGGKCGFITLVGSLRTIHDC